MEKSEWTEEDAKRWHELCTTDPEKLTTEEKIEGIKLAERAYAFLLGHYKNEA